jgi:hypothetical protein
LPGFLCIRPGQVSQRLFGSIRLPHVGLAINACLLASLLHVLRRGHATSVSAVLASYRRALDAAGPKATVSKALLDADDLPAQLPLDVQVNKPRA